MPSEQEAAGFLLPAEHAQCMSQWLASRKVAACLLPAKSLMCRVNGRQSGLHAPTGGYIIVVRQ